MQIGQRIAELQQKKKSLEDIFMQVIGEGTAV